jgi:hypothetical protein
MPPPPRFATAAASRRRTSRKERRLKAAYAPSPTFVGEDNSSSFPRCAFASESRHATARKPFVPPLKKEAERRQAHHWFPPRRRDKSLPAYAARTMFAPCPALARDLRAARSPFGAPPRRYAEALPRLGSGPRFLESPDPNGSTLSGTSAASTWQSGHAPDGRCQNRTETRCMAALLGTALVPLSKVPSRKALRERDVIDTGTNLNGMSPY